jgi:hypothetical protein
MCRYLPARRSRLSALAGNISETARTQEFSRSQRGRGIAASESSGTFFALAVNKFQSNFAINTELPALF